MTARAVAGTAARTESGGGPVRGGRVHRPFRRAVVVEDQAREAPVARLPGRRGGGLLVVPRLPARTFPPASPSAWMGGAGRPPTDVAHVSSSVSAVAPDPRLRKLCLEASSPLAPLCPFLSFVSPSPSCTSAPASAYSDRCPRASPTLNTRHVHAVRYRFPAVSGPGVATAASHACRTTRARDKTAGRASSPSPSPPAARRRTDARGRRGGKTSRSSGGSQRPPPRRRWARRPDDVRAPTAPRKEHAARTADVPALEAQCPPVGVVGVRAGRAREELRAGREERRRRSRQEDEVPAYPAPQPVGPAHAPTRRTALPVRSPPPVRRGGRGGVRGRPPAEARRRPRREVQVGILPRRRPARPGEEEARRSGPDQAEAECRRPLRACPRRADAR